MSNFGWGIVGGEGKYGLSLDFFRRTAFNSFPSITASFQGKKLAVGVPGYGS